MIQFTPELVMFPDLMSFEYPKVLLFLLVIHYKSRCPSKAAWNTMHYRLRRISTQFVMYYKLHDYYKLQSNTASWQFFFWTIYDWWS